MVLHRHICTCDTGWLNGDHGVRFTKLRARADRPASSPLRAAAVLLGLRATGSLRSSKHPENGRASRTYRRLRAPCPPDGGLLTQNTRE